MATEGTGLSDGGCITGGDFSPTGSYTAYGANSSGQYLAVKMSASADKTVVIADGGAETIFGVIQNNPKTGLAADVKYVGITKAVFGGTVTAGQKLKTDTHGRFVAITASGDVAVAETQEAGAIGEVHTIRLFGCATTHPF